MAQQLPQLITIIVAAFDQRRSPCTLECVSVAVEVFGSDGADFVQSFSTLLSHLSSQSLVSLQQAGRGPTDDPDLIKGLFNMAQRYLLFCPLAFFATTANPASPGATVDSLSMLMDVATACVGCVMDREALRCVLQFLTALFRMRQTHLAEHDLTRIQPQVSRQGRARAGKGGHGRARGRVRGRARAWTNEWFS